MPWWPLGEPGRPPGGTSRAKTIFTTSCRGGGRAMDGGRGARVGGEAGRKTKKHVRSKCFCWDGNYESGLGNPGPRYYLTSPYNLKSFKRPDFLLKAL